jgi:hypothetical protein
VTTLFSTRDDVTLAAATPSRVNAQAPRRARIVLALEQCDGKPDPRRQAPRHLAHDGSPRARTLRPAAPPQTASLAPLFFRSAAPPAAIHVPGASAKLEDVMKAQWIAPVVVAVSLLGASDARAGDSVWHEFCSTCTWNIAEYFDYDKHCKSPLATLYLRRCVESCKIAGEKGILSMLGDLAGECLRRIANGQGNAPEDEDFASDDEACYDAPVVDWGPIYTDALDVCIDADPANQEPADEQLDATPL